MIYLECYADEALLKSFGATSKMIKHAFSKGEVCNMLRKATNSVGVVDEDPNAGKSSYEKFMLQRMVYEDAKIILCEDKKSGNKLAIVRPRLEDLIIKIAKDNKIEIESYSLSPLPKRLHDELTFRKNRQKFKDLNRLLSDLLMKEKALIELRKFII